MSFVKSVITNDHAKVLTALNSGYNISIIDLVQIIEHCQNQDNFPPSVNLCIFHLNSREKFITIIFEFAMFGKPFDQYLNSIETIKSDTEFNELVQIALLHRYDGMRHYIHQGYHRDEYPIQMIVDRLLVSPRVNLVNPPQRVVDSLLKESKLDIFKQFISKGFRPNNYYFTPLLTHDPKMREFLYTMIDVNVKNPSGETALIKIAKRYNHSLDKHLIADLLEHGAEPSIRDNLGRDTHYYLSLHCISIPLHFPSY